MALQVVWKGAEDWGSGIVTILIRYYCLIKQKKSNIGYISDVIRLWNCLSSWTYPVPAY